MEKAQINYQTVLDYLDTETSYEGDEKGQRDGLVLAARLNLAAVELKLGDNGKVIEHCGAALAIQGDSAKAFFRRAQVNFLIHLCIHFTVCIMCQKYVLSLVILVIITP